jgi:hypothetical protein
MDETHIAGLGLKPILAARLTEGIATLKVQ